ncbi:MAG: M23 family metallopeptidase, partial [Spirochaetota bacterium]
PVYAVNDGIVSGVIAGYFDNPPGGFSASGNTITINHGSYSSFYAHLKYEGIVVKEKQKVKRGQLIGYNGNTGMSSESHLHFCVYSNRLPEYITIPFRFQKGKLITKSGKMIRSSRPYREGEIALFPNR